ncbi:MAG TPA: hypothetical protein VEU62_17635 [Bryobacterales bacterium]|nr:hypothetical protein [Bryobacterales bacterium]
MKLLKLLVTVAILLPVFATRQALAESPGGAYYSPVASPVSPAQAEARSGRARWKKRWIATWLAIAALNTLDIQSSRGHGEANPLLRDPSGRFSAGKAMLLKSAIGGGLFATEWWIARRNPRQDYYKPFTVLNTAAAGGLVGVVVHNYSLPPTRAASPALTAQP